MTYKLVHQARSPDGRYVATVILRDPGATGYGGHCVGIRTLGASYDREACQIAVFKYNGHDTVDLAWPGGSLEVIGCANAMLKGATSWRDVPVRYVQPRSRGLCGSPR